MKVNKVENPKSKRKKLTVGICIILAVAMTITTVIPFINATSKAEEYMKMYVKKTYIGSSIKGEITEKGKSTYPQVLKYQVYENNKPISAKTEFGKLAIIYPAKKSGKIVEVHLISFDDKEVAITRVKLLKFEENKNK